MFILDLFLTGGMSGQGNAAPGGMPCQERCLARRDVSPGNLPRRELYLARRHGSQQVCLAKTYASKWC